MKSLLCRPSVVAMRPCSPSARSYPCPTSSSMNSSSMRGGPPPEGGADGPQAEGARPEAGEGAPRPERIGRDLPAVEGLESIADRIGEADQLPDAALVRHGRRFALDAYAVRLQARGQRVRR